MINASQIKENMEVKGSDGKHVGTVLGVEGATGQDSLRRHGPLHRHRIGERGRRREGYTQEDRRRDRANVALVRLGRQFVLWPIKPSADRRFALSALLLTPVYQVWGAAVARAQSDDLRPIVQPTKKTKAPYLAPARALRDQAVRGGDQAFGAVVVCDGIIVGGCRNYVVLHHDFTARARRATPCPHVPGRTVLGAHPSLP